MLRLRGFIISQLLSSASTSPISHLHRLFSVSPNPPNPPNRGFAVEDYLVDSCGLTRPETIKASMKLSHLKSPANPDAVLAFLAGLGLSRTDVAAAVIKDPLLLCAGVERTLSPVVVGLTGLGLSSPEIAGLVPAVPDGFRRKSVVSKLQCYLPIFGSIEKLLWMVKHRPYLLSGANTDKVVKPNLVFLRECGLHTCDIAKLCNHMPKILTTRSERVQEMVAWAEGLGVPRGSGMFKEALQAVAFCSKEKIAAKVDYLKKTFRWSDDEVSIALTKAPSLLRKSEYMLRRKSEFLILEVRLEPAYIARQPVMIALSLEGRLRSRHYILKFLKENGFLDLDQDRSFATAVKLTNDAFVEKYICPHNEVAPQLAEHYAAACRGEVPANFRFA